MAQAQLKKAPQAPPLFTANPRAIIDKAKLLVEQSRRVQDAVVKSVQPETAEAAAELNPSFRWNSLKKDITKFDGPETMGMGYEWNHVQVTFPPLHG
jgi:hypothetical protein